MRCKNFTILSILFVLAFIYCFGIGIFKDSDMKRYFINGFYMTNYGIEGIKGYPNQLFSLFLYWGYKITGNWYGLSNILFFPVYLFGLYSLHQVLNYFIKQDYIALLFTLLFLLVGMTMHHALYFSSYIVYFFFFISIVYLSVYFPTKIYLIGLYLAIASLFRNQIATFLPFIALIINHQTVYKTGKANLIKTGFTLLVSLLVVQVGYEAIKTIAISEKSEEVNFGYYFKELDNFLFKSNFFTNKGLIFFLTYNLRNYYFYLVVLPCFFMFNKNFTNKIKNNRHILSLLKIFLMLSLFIYFMPAIMYINVGLDYSVNKYSPLLSRYSFIMIPLLIPIYHFILKEQTVVKLKSKMLYITMAILLLPALRFKRIPTILKNTFVNISQKKEFYGIDSAKVKDVLKNNFTDKAFFISNDKIARIYVGHKDRFIEYYHMFNLSTHKNGLDLKNIDGVILIGESYPYLVTKKTIYTKIYEEKSDKPISIYKKAN